MQHPSHLVPFRPGLAFWITLGILGSAMITLLVLLVLVNNFSAHYAQSRAATEVRLTADNMANTLYWQLAERIRDLQLLAGWSAFHQQPPPAQRAVLNEVVAKTPNYHWLLVTDADGKIKIASDPTLEGAWLPRHQNGLPPFLTKGGSHRRRWEGNFVGASAPLVLNVLLNHIQRRPAARACKVGARPKHGLAVSPPQVQKSITQSP